MSQAELVLDCIGYMICVNPWRLTGLDAERLQDMITQSRIELTAYGQLPPKEDETREAWTERYAEFLAEERKPKKDELAAAYVKRLFEPKAFKENTEFAHAVLKHCCDLVNQGSRITPEVAKQIPILEMTNFITTICKVCRCPVPEISLD